MKYDFLIWVAAFVIFIVVELVTEGLVTLWFAAGSVITFFVALATDNFIVQLIVFVVSSILLLIFTKPILQKKFSKGKSKTNVESVLGQTCRVTEEINNFNEKGVVVINGVEWSARSENDATIPVGSKVKVCSVSGVKVIVSLEA